MATQRTAISLFSGCGGDTLGLERAGFKVVAFNEFKQAAVDTHLANFPESKALVEPKKTTGDITKLPDSMFEEYKGKVDIVFAGFPCQGFSKAGNKKENDPRNQMYRQFVRVVNAVKPPFIIGENVTGLLSMKSGPREDDPMMIEVIRKAFHDIGYSISYNMLEADEFGVPQSRKRLLIVGWRTEQFPDFAPEPFWANVHSWGSTQTAPTLASFIKPTLEGAYLLDTRAVPPNFDLYAIDVDQNTPVTGQPHPYVVLKASSFDETYQGKTFDRLLSCAKRESPIHSEVLNLNQSSKTIICTYDHQPRLLVGLKKPDGSRYVRTLLPDELKQIQGFPANFALCGNTKEQVVQVGNAVPPALVEAVARSIVPSLAPLASSPSVPPKKPRVIRKKPLAT